MTAPAGAAACIAQQIRAEIQAERSLANAPRVSAVDPEYTEAVALALRHARGRLRLPARLPIVWHAAPRGNEGEAWTFSDGTAEVHINVGRESSPRRIAWVMAHEAKHVSDGPGRPGLTDQEGEDGANRFADDLLEHPDLLRLDNRPRSGVAVKGAPMSYDTNASGPHAERRRALVREGQGLAALAERERRGFTAGERQRAAAILVELDGLRASPPPASVPVAASVPLARARCVLCGALRPQWGRCQCGALGWGFSG